MNSAPAKKHLTRSIEKPRDIVPSGTVSATDRGFLYGDGLFETIAVQSNCPLLLDLHLNRLADGCERLDIPIDVTKARKAVLKACTDVELGVVRVSLTRGQGGEGYRPPVNAHPNLIVSTRPWPNRFTANQEQGIETGLSDVQLSCQPLLAGLKHMNRLEQVMARLHSPKAWPEVIMTNASREVIEGSFSNIFLLDPKGELITPDLSSCGVSGVIRKTVINLANDERRPVVVRNVRISELLSATELFFTNSLIGVWPIRKFEGKIFAVNFAREMHAKLQSISAVIDA
ncbi:MAG: aminodeoxychorismate lyase [Proteobacteria bacterium]|nr:aminodeoxychorismate lyase [Pseudomonadota bacterium]